MVKTKQNFAFDFIECAGKVFERGHMCAGCPFDSKCGVNLLFNNRDRFPDGYDREIHAQLITNGTHINVRVVEDGKIPQDLKLDVKRCPHCGGDILDLTQGPVKHALIDDAWYVWCTFCGSRGPDDETIEGAINGWNMRDRTA